MNKSAVFETELGGRYLASLCQHFGTKVSVTYGAGTGRVEFPTGTCDMTADESCLAFVVQADTRENLEVVMQVVSSHLDRFAFRENPELVWKDTAD